MRKIAALMVLLILIASGIMLATTASALIPKPSAPEFTVKLVNSPYNVTTKDPYNGVNVTQQFDNNTIQVMIKNQPFAYSINGLTYHLYYNVRTEPHFVGNWTERYPVVDRPNSPYDWVNKSWSYSKYLNPNAPPQSNSDYTVISYALGENGYYLFTKLPPNAQVDFQVQAIVGHDSQAWAIVHPFSPEYGGYYEPAIAYDDASDWSNTQTLTIDDSTSTATPTASPSLSSPTPTSSASPSPNPTATSTKPDTQNGLMFGLDWKDFVIVLLGVAVALLVLVVALSRRRSVK